MKVSEGQCGMCAHFGEHHSSDQQIVQIRVRGEAPDGYVDACGHPDHTGLHLTVSANSGCDGFARVQAA